MSVGQFAELLLLAAIWGSSFLFMRVAVPEFGPLALMLVRTGVAAIVLAPLLLAARRRVAWRADPLGMLWLGLLNSALPFALFGYAALHLGAGVLSIMNATAPFWAALVARVWLGETLRARQLVGLAVGFAGVVTLVLGRGEPLVADALVAVGAALAATLSYGLAANLTRRRFQGADPLGVATGSQWTASLWLAPAAVPLWPTVQPSAHAWGAVLVLAVLCTAVAYVIFFRLIASLGATRAITVTFLVPVFGVLWGASFLGERPTYTMLAGALAVLVGVALTSISPRRAGSTQ
ncbi:MAG: DMT family transporter [Burkholderiaceae bacterium]|nr:DMT family transporter [Burkholderiaceae bacterium]